MRWANMASLLLHAHLSCVDGRDETGVAGTPGGDAGELLLALAALERVTGRALSRRDVAEILDRRIDTFGRFYLHGDTDTTNELIEAIRADARFDGALDGV